LIFLHWTKYVQEGSLHALHTITVTVKSFSMPPADLTLILELSKEAFPSHRVQASMED
jgi:hypothetical protein